MFFFVVVVFFSYRAGLNTQYTKWCTFSPWNCSVISFIVSQRQLPWPGNDKNTNYSASVPWCKNCKWTHMERLLQMRATYVFIPVSASRLSSVLALIKVKLLVPFMVNVEKPLFLYSREWFILDLEDCGEDMSPIKLHYCIKS